MSRGLGMCSNVVKETREVSLTPDNTADVLTHMVQTAVAMLTGRL